MADKFDKKTRSRIMSKIKGKDTRPEILLRKALFKQGYRYSLKYRFRELNFKPDLVMVSKRTCIFVDGCFWHKCSRCYKEPKSNKRYWSSKIKRNVQRDREQNKYLKENGWRNIRIWEHEINSDLKRTIQKINNRLNALK